MVRDTHFVRPHHERAFKRNAVGFSALFFMLIVMILTSITALLFVEYYFFAEQYKKMIEYKRTYRAYALLYKNMLYAEQNGLFSRSPVQQFFENNQLLISALPDKMQNVQKNNEVNSTKKEIKQQKPFRFKWPIERSRFWLSSRYGPRKKPNGSWGYHYGIDMAAPKGTSVFASSTGVVIEAAYSNKGYGKTVVIAHSDGIHQTRYAHLHAIFVKVGISISVGDRIGSVGNTGFVRGENGTHLHFEVKKRGKHIDPLCVLA